MNNYQENNYMKNLLISLLVLLMALPVLGQKKGKDDKKEQTDTLNQIIDTPVVKASSPVITDTIAAMPAPVSAGKKDSIITVVNTESLEMDSLYKITNTLTAKLNVVSTELERYRGVYTAIKEKVLQRDFDPEKMSQILDSLAAKRDSTFSKLVQFAAIKDSLATLRRDYSNLQNSLDLYKTADAEKERLIKELKLLKDLLDSRILTQVEFDTKKAIVLQKWK